MSKKKMQQAQQLIKAKDYAAARNILRTVDHPKAREWEARLDQIAPVTKAAASGRRVPVALLLGIGAVVLIAVVVVALLLISNNAAPAPQVADEPTLEATTAAENPTPTPEIAQDPTSAPPPPAGDDRPAQLPAEFPFPAGGFSQVFDLSDEDEIEFSVYSPMTFDELDAFYREALPAAGYEFLDFSAGDTVILSFLGKGTLGSVRVTEDGPEGEARLTISMESTSATSLADLEPGGSQATSGDIRFDTPEAAAAAFMQAIADGDSVTVLALICEDNKQFFDEDAYLSGMMGPAVPGGELDTTGLQFASISLSPDVSEVQITGRFLVRVTVAETVTEIPVPIEDPIVIEFHNIDGWQVCSLE